MGRPRSPNPLVVVGCRVTKEVKAGIENMAKSNGLGVSDLVGPWVVKGYEEAVRKQDVNKSSPPSEGPLNQ